MKKGKKSDVSTKFTFDYLRAIKRNLRGGWRTTTSASLTDGQWCHGFQSFIAGPWTKTYGQVLAK
jgi:hypothetical protein